MPAQDGETTANVRQRDRYVAIEATRASERGVERVAEVGRADDDDLIARREAVHFDEQLIQSLL